MVSSDHAQQWVAGTAAAGALVICLAAVSGIWRISTTDNSERAHTILERGDVLWTTAADDNESVAAIRARILPAAEPAANEPQPAANEQQMSWHDRRAAAAGATPVFGAPAAVNAPLLEPIETSSADARPAAEPEVAVTGLWVPDTNTCSLRSFREGFLPTIINNDGAWAGETFCLFKNRKPITSGWQVAADCSSEGKQWSVQVRLTLKGNHLIWESRRGRQVYTRCSPDLRMAEGQ